MAKNKALKKNEAKNRFIIGTTAVVEVILMSLLFYFVWRNLYPKDLFPPYYGRGKYVLMGLYALISAVMIHFCDGFKFGYLKTADLLFSQWIAMLVTNFVSYFELSLIANVMVSPGPVFVAFAADIVICSIAAGAYSVLYYKRYVQPQNILLVYGNKEAATLKLKMATRGDKYNVSRLMSIEEGIEAVEKEALGYDAIVICDVSAEIRNDLIKFCYSNGIIIYATPKISDVMIRGAEDVNLFDTPLVLINSGGLNLSQRFFKRGFDLFISILALVILSPIMLIVALCIKLEDGGPVFFKQKRCTRGCEEFDIIKFRSMIVDADKDGYHGATENDNRITKVGHVIRACRIDELPQLFNIIKGDMSIVGPRPERIENVEEYTNEIPEFVFRCNVKGGLTGYAQVYGKYNTTAYDKLKLDLMYIENYSLLLDLRLILMTIRVLFKKESTEGFDKVLTVEDLSPLTGESSLPPISGEVSAKPTEGSKTEGAKAEDTNPSDQNS